MGDLKVDHLGIYIEQFWYKVWPLWHHRKYCEKFTQTAVDFCFLFYIFKMRIMFPDWNHIRNVLQYLGRVWMTVWNVTASKAFSQYSINLMKKWYCNYFCMQGLIQKWIDSLNFARKTSRFLTISIFIFP